MIALPTDFSVRAKFHFRGLLNALAVLDSLQEEEAKFYKHPSEKKIPKMIKYMDQGIKAFEELDRAYRWLNVHRNELAHMMLIIHPEDKKEIEWIKDAIHKTSVKLRTGKLQDHDMVQRQKNMLAALLQKDIPSYKREYKASLAAIDHAKRSAKKLERAERRFAKTVDDPIAKKGVRKARKARWTIRGALGYATSAAILALSIAGSANAALNPDKHEVMVQKLHQELDEIAENLYFSFIQNLPQFTEKLLNLATQLHEDSVKNANDHTAPLQTPVNMENVRQWKSSIDFALRDIEVIENQLDAVEITQVPNRDLEIKMQTAVTETRVRLYMLKSKYKKLRKINVASIQDIIKLTDLNSGLSELQRITDNLRKEFRKFTQRQHAITTRTSGK